ncbi:hypothetical protein H6794_02795 [Candidatus Nomurabacteria bacterium]|jgi:hypothetical protein|nr:hypothetical protein [Candidatus Saccharibacteria bacterium]MCB9839759.1 hypothetical protein [Candidatus Nomurabacteria bacterium]
MDKKTVYLVISAGGFIGAYLPVLLFNADGFGLVSIVGGVIGSIIGIVVAYKLIQNS